MLVLVGEGAQFVLDAGAVAGADALNRAVEKGRAAEAPAQNFVYLRRGVDQETRQLILDRAPSTPLSIW